MSIYDIYRYPDKYSIWMSETSWEIGKKNALTLPISLQRPENVSSLTVPLCPFSSDHIHFHTHHFIPYC
jgi:hypothetical protein